MLSDGLLYSVDFKETLKQEREYYSQNPQKEYCSLYLDKIENEQDFDKQSLWVLHHTLNSQLGHHQYLPLIKFITDLIKTDGDLTKIENALTKTYGETESDKSKLKEGLKSVYGKIHELKVAYSLIKNFSKEIKALYLPKNSININPFEYLKSDILVELKNKDSETGANFLSIGVSTLRKDRRRANRFRFASNLIHFINNKSHRDKIAKKYGLKFSFKGFFLSNTMYVSTINYQTSLRKNLKQIAEEIRNSIKKYLVSNKPIKLKRSVESYSVMDYISALLEQGKISTDFKKLTT